MVHSSAQSFEFQTIIPFRASTLLYFCAHGAQKTVFGRMSRRSCSIGWLQTLQIMVKIFDQIAGQLNKK
jgi:hypothetical protein